MGAWLLKAFSGETPRITPNLLAPNGAQEARNVRLDDGALTPLREPSHIHTFPGYPGYQTIYRHLDTWLGFTGIVHCAPGPVATNRLYITGDGVPKMRVGTDVYNLAVPAPAAALTAAASALGSRIYKYSYVSDTAVESGPSPATAAVDWISNRTVTLSDFEAIPTLGSGAVTKQRFYRSDDGGTTWSLVTERAASTADFLDDVVTATVGALPSASAVTAPVVAPKAAFGYLEAPTTRAYVYTYVTSFGEESEPSPAVLVDWEPGQSVTLSGFVVAPAGRASTLQRIYRTQTGTAGTDLYFIAERADASTNYIDTIAVDAFGEVIPSRAYNAPPDGLQGLIGMPNGMMAAFSGRDLYLCEPWQPHAWPQVYSQTTDFDIVALGAVGTSIVVMTKGNPYIVQGTDPTSMQMTRIESNLPCINARGVQDLGFAIAYPTHEGLVMAGGDGSARVVTDSLFNRESWQKLNPGILCAGQLSGRYFLGFNTTDNNGAPLAGTIVINGASGSPFITRANAIAQAWFYDITEGALYFLTDKGDVKRFDPPSGDPSHLYWRSKPFLLPYPAKFGVIQIDGDAAPTADELANIAAARAAAAVVNATLMSDPLGSEINGGFINEYAFGGDGLVPIPSVAKTASVTIFADGKPVATITKIGRMARLPAGFMAREWEIAIFGTSTIKQIALAGTAAELQMMAVG